MSELVVSGCSNGGSVGKTIIDDFAGLIDAEVRMVTALQQIVQQLRAGQSLEQACIVAAQSTNTSLFEVSSRARLLWLGAQRGNGFDCKHATLPQGVETTQNHAAAPSYVRSYIIARIPEDDRDEFDFFSTSSSPRQQWTTDRSQARVWLHREDAERVAESIPGGWVYVMPFDESDKSDLTYYVTGMDSEGRKVWYRTGKVTKRWLRDYGDRFISRRLAEVKAAELRLNPPTIRRDRKTITVDPASIQVETEP